LTEEETFKKVVEALHGGWRYYYARVSPNLYCVFEVETLKPIKYFDDVPAARFWVSQYESGTEVPE